MKNPELLAKRFEKNISGVLSCFDRLVLFGTYQPICYPKAMSWQVLTAGLKLIDYEKRFANKLRLEMIDRIKTVATGEGIPIQHVYASVRKEAFVSEILSARGDTSGIVCILSAMEGCRCFKVSKNHKSGYLEPQWKPGKCLHYYVYVMDPEYGLCYLRIPTRAPFRLQFYFNGHGWLERRMAAEGIEFRKADNCFVYVSDYQRAQQIVDTFDVKSLHQRLDQLATRFVAVYGRWGQGLHWSIYQVEWATDVVFKSSRILPVLYEELVGTAAIEIKCSDIYGFLGRRLSVESASQASKRLQTLIEGTRIKDSLDKTPIKMYDKQERVLRIETTTNDVSFFKHHREVKHRDGTREMKYASTKKTIYSLGAVAELMQACNKRYLSFISRWRDHSRERTDLRKITDSVKDDRQWSYRGVNFFQSDDLGFMLAIMRGEYQIAGFTNRSLQQHLVGWNPQRIGRVLKRFRVLRLIKRDGRTYKYYLSSLGKRVLVAVLQLKERVILPTMAIA
ncbi:MAG: hypothetical protein QF493_14335 [Rhodospirillales bacterium]|nr:hypothetical protein [Rhodospirillales bacterium]